MEQFTESDFEGTRLHATGPYAVCFQTTWCPFCVEFLPKFLALEGAVPFRLALVDLSAESSPLWETFSVDIVPTVVAFREGAEFWRKDGVPGYGLDQHDLKSLKAAFASPPI